MGCNNKSANVQNVVAGEVDELMLEYEKKGKLEDLVPEGVLLNMTKRKIEEALEGSERENWLEAFKVEFEAISKTGTFAKITPEARKLLNEGKLVVHGTRPVLTTKLNEKGEIARYKVRLVVQGYTMQHGIDYDKTFSPCARMNTIRLVVAIAVVGKWNVFHSDVPNAYLNGTTPHLVLVRLPKLWNQIINSQIGLDGDPVIMAKSLYGAPDAGRNWNIVFTDLFVKEGYTQLKKEPCLFLKGIFPHVAIFAIWVDDCFSTGGDQEEMQRMLNVLKQAVNIKILGHLSFALGISFQWSESGVKMSQEAFIERILKKFGMENANGTHLPVQKGFKPLYADCPKSEKEKENMKKIPYRSAIGSLLYIALCTRPDILFSVCALARFSQNPGPTHWTGVKSIMRYLKETSKLKLTYKFPVEVVDLNQNLVHGWSDAAFNDSDDGRSTYGYVVFVHKYPIAWKSKISTSIPQSTFESEWIAMNSALREMIWCQYLLQDILHKEKCLLTLYVDNRACIQRLDERVMEGNKHFRPKYFFVTEEVKKKRVSVIQVPSERNISDITTKALGDVFFSRHRLSLCLE
jgi:hypothetical protein